MFHMITLEQMLANNLSQIFFLLLLLNRIDSISNLYIFTYLISLFYCIGFSNVEKTNFSHPPIRPMPHPHLQTNPDYPRRDLPGCRIRRADRSSRGSCRRFGFEMGCLICTPADDRAYQSISLP